MSKLTEQHRCGQNIEYSHLPNKRAHACLLAQKFSHDMNRKDEPNIQSKPEMPWHGLNVSTTPTHNGKEGIFQSNISLHLTIKHLITF